MPHDKSTSFCILLWPLVNLSFRTLLLFLVVFDTTLLTWIDCIKQHNTHYSDDKHPVRFRTLISELHTDENPWQTE